MLCCSHGWNLSRIDVSEKKGNNLQSVCTTYPLEEFWSTGKILMKKNQGRCEIQEVFIFSLFYFFDGRNNRMYLSYGKGLEERVKLTTDNSGHWQNGRNSILGKTRVGEIVGAGGGVGLLFLNKNHIYWRCRTWWFYKSISSISISIIYLCMYIYIHTHRDKWLLVKPININ